MAGPPPTIRTIIFDLGDVLFKWSASTTTSISPKTLRRILNSSPTWFEYERGRISESDCYETIGREHSLDPEQLREALIQARASLCVDPDMVNLIHQIRARADQITIVAMSNISGPDYETVLETRGQDLALFDRVFPSCEAGERKPHLGFYKQVLQETNSDPATTAMIDDKTENVLTARSLGIHGIVFANAKQVRREVLNLVGDPIRRGLSFLHQNAGRLHSVTQKGQEVRENFTQLLILEALKDRTLVNFVEHPRTWQFFAGADEFHTADFPCDFDTTSIALTVLPRNHVVVSSVLDEILTYRDNDGIVMTYFDPKRPRIDPVVCVNVLSLFYSHKRGADLRPTFDWVCQVLHSRAYLDGTRYYYGPEPFLYFLSRLISNNPNDRDIQTLIRPVYAQRVAERIGQPGHAQELAMRLISCATVGIINDRDLATLLKLQDEDGSWEVGWFYEFVSLGMYVGNQGLTTALAICGIEMVQQLKGQIKGNQRQTLLIPKGRLQLLAPPSPTPSDEANPIHYPKGGRSSRASGKTGMGNETWLRRVWSNINATRRKSVSECTDPESL
jgi:FMN phosphatase YigB (HAD superfamily)